jgi:hypothetical protein
MAELRRKHDRHLSPGSEYLNVVDQDRSRRLGRLLPETLEIHCSGANRIFLLRLNQ